MWGFRLVGWSLSDRARWDDSRNILLAGSATRLERVMMQNVFLTWLCVTKLDRNPKFFKKHQELSSLVNSSQISAKNNTDSYSHFVIWWNIDFVGNVQRATGNNHRQQATCNTPGRVPSCREAVGVPSHKKWVLCNPGMFWPDSGVDNYVKSKNVTSTEISSKHF